MLVTRGLGGHAQLVLWGFGAELEVTWPAVEPGVHTVVVGSDLLAETHGSVELTESRGGAQAELAMVDGTQQMATALAQPAIAVAVEVDA